MNPMKNTISVFPAILGLILLMMTAACTKDDGFVTPVADLQLSSASVMVNEEVTFENLGQGQKVTFFTGKEGEVYGKLNAYGLSVEPGNPYITTTYVKSGTYNVVVIVTGFNRDGTVIETDIDSTSLTVTDTVRSINMVVYNNLYTMLLMADASISFNYSPEVRPDANRNFVIPIHDYRVNGLFYLMRSDGKNVTNASRYSFKPLVVGNSLSLSYEINDEPLYNTGNKVFDHSDPDDNTAFVPMKITTVSADGSKLDYYACPVFMPYFTSFSLGSGGTDYPGQFWVSRLDYTEFEYVVSVPVAADSTNLTPAYILNDTENVTVSVVNDGKPESDYSGDGEVTYELIYTRPKTGKDAYLGEITFTTVITVKAVFNQE